MKVAAAIDSSTTSAYRPCNKFLYSSVRRPRRISSIPSPPAIRRPFHRYRHVGVLPSTIGPLPSSSVPTLPSREPSAAGASPCFDELELFLELLPPRMRTALSRHLELKQLVEVVLDLGRKPVARFPSGDWKISQEPVKHEDLQHAVSKVGEFSEDNRSGINSSLHRISAIRNRKMQIIGLTCRVGRAISGSAEMMRDLVGSGGSILVIGPPGVGKTTLIRDVARMLADDYMKRVVIVDTSNEIGGDGDVPHSGIGRARRMQVPNVNMQHNIMIEAVENHMPEVIIIDEIGTELEAMAASTIAQRGVQLVGTAHGVTIENIMKNPCLQILVGGIESVTLGDEEAKKRKVQKTILERKGPPTFTCAVEMISKTECRVYHKLESTVDAILAGKSPLFEVRQMDSKPINDAVFLGDNTNLGQLPYSCINDDDVQEAKIADSMKGRTGYVNKESHNILSDWISPARVYTFKILEDDLLQVTTVLGLETEIDVTDDIGNANAILVLSSELKQNPWIRAFAKFHKLPVFVLKKNSMAQIVKAVQMILRMKDRGSQSKESFSYDAGDIEIKDDAPKRKPSLEEIDALEEVRMAIEYIVIPGGEPVELLPRCSEIIALQLELVESYQLAAERSGTELNSRLHILPHRLNQRQSSVNRTVSNENVDRNSLASGSEGTNVTRLPLLPN